MTVKIGALNFRPVETGRGQHALTKRWMPHAVADPLLFLATLNFAAAHLDNIHGRPSSPRTIAQKIETVRLIYSRLQGSVDSVSATTIGAVALLAAMEIITTGNHHELSVDMVALEEMVRMRGGLQQSACSNWGGMG
ncbi:hypothetical protein HO133_008400 [Letharia lupina]|uniref:Uncharacterized protein n=1 Tax=Letharia lupina TaxID=560253 RepID=A0A8H6CPB9_9LECA|nr:uncharacterized protein HO133_008400 [Letharia lupina]KAF6226959.1 hypothetical protein HO133_008400 [Letharia lupina]